MNELIIKHLYYEYVNGPQIKPKNDLKRDTISVNSVV